MRDYRSSLLILLSVLLLISTGMLIAALYHFYYKTPVMARENATQQLSNNSPAFKADSKDSVLNGTKDDIATPAARLNGAPFNTDSLEKALDSRLKEFYQLRNEINALTVARDNNPGEGITRQKMLELEQRINKLHFVNKDIENENRRLKILLNQAKATNSEANNVNSYTLSENRQVNKTTTDADVFIVNDLRFSAHRLNDDQETNIAVLTEKLTTSFKVKNPRIQKPDAELILVVLQPDGRVLQQSDWDAGSFETKEGKKLYSRKMLFEYNKGEAKQIRFSLTADDFQQGVYTIKIYHHGKLIGNMSRQLR